MPHALTQRLAILATVALLFVPVSEAARTRPAIGPNYWATGFRGSTVFLAHDVSGAVRYTSDPAVRALVRSQLQEMFDKGANIVMLRLHQGRIPGSDFVTADYYEQNFPLTQAEVDALRLLLLDIAEIGDPSTNRGLHAFLSFSAPYTQGAPGKGRRVGSVAKLIVPRTPPFGPVEVELTGQPPGFSFTVGERDVLRFDNFGCAGVAKARCCDDPNNECGGTSETLDETNAASFPTNRIVEGDVFEVECTSTSPTVRLKLIGVNAIQLLGSCGNQQVITYGTAEPCQPSYPTYRNALDPRSNMYCGMTPCLGGALPFADAFIANLASIVDAANDVYSVHDGQLVVETLLLMPDSAGVAQPANDDDPMRLLLSYGNTAFGGSNWLFEDTTAGGSGLYRHFMQTVLQDGNGIAPTIYASCGSSPGAWTDPYYPEITGKTMMFQYRWLKFLIERGLPLPDRIGFGNYTHVSSYHDPTLDEFDEDVVELMTPYWPAFSGFVTETYHEADTTLRKNNYDAWRTAIGPAPPGHQAFQGLTFWTVFYPGPWRSIFDTVGVYEPSAARFTQFDANAAACPRPQIQFGNANWVPLFGDWDLDGRGDIGAFDPAAATGSNFHLRTLAGTVSQSFHPGGCASGCKPVVGDWNQDGHETVGLFQPSTSTFYLTDAWTGGTAPVTYTYVFSPCDGQGSCHQPGANLVPIAGIWCYRSDGDRVGFYDPDEGRFYFSLQYLPDLGTPIPTRHRCGPREGNQSVDWYAMDYRPVGWTPAWLPLVADYNGEGLTTPGLFDSATGRFYLTNESPYNLEGVYQEEIPPFIRIPEQQQVDIEPIPAFSVGSFPPNAIPIAGNWDGTLTPPYDYTDLLPLTATPVIERLEPQAVIDDVGSQNVTIVGRNFAPNSEVLVNNLPVTPPTMTDSHFVAPDFTFAGRTATFNVKVRVGTQDSAPVPLTYVKRPVISSITQSAGPGGTMKIRGDWFASTSSIDVFLAGCAGGTPDFTVPARSYTPILNDYGELAFDLPSGIPRTTTSFGLRANAVEGASSCQPATTISSTCVTATLDNGVPTYVKFDVAGANGQRTLPAYGSVSTTFTFTKTAGPAGATYQWDFGDGSPVATGTTAQHQYAAPASYTVTLTAQDGSAAPPRRTVQDAVVVVPAAGVKPVILTGAGPSPASPNLNNLPLFRGLAYNPVVDATEPTTLNAIAYGAPKYGVNVAAGNVEDPAVARALTGPGPGDVYGPQVRGWRTSAGGAAISKINFFAYGTLKFGVNVAAGSIDGDAYHEIVTGAGPGQVFGPHVRGWNYDGVGITPINKVSFTAYSSGGYGVNVAVGEIDLDAFDEIATGPGPDPGQQGQLSLWNYDGSPVVNMRNFMAHADFHGLKVDVGTLAAGKRYVVTARGAGATNIDAITPYEVTGCFPLPCEVTPLTPVTPFSPFHRYGTNLSVANVDNEPDEEVVAGEGPSSNPSTTTSRVVALYLDEQTLLLDDVPGLDAEAFTNVGYGYGVTVAASEDFPASGGIETAAPTPTDKLLLQVRQNVLDTPDATYVCDHCDLTQPQPDWNVWGATSQKQVSLTMIDTLHEELPDWTPAQITGESGTQGIDDIIAAIGDPVLGMTNADMKAELVAQLLEVRASYAPMAFPSTGVTAELDPPGEPSDLAFSSSSGKLFVRPGSASAGVVGVVDAPSLRLEADRAVPTSAGDVQRLSVPAGRSEVYAITRRSGGGFGCNPCYSFALERIVPPGTLPPDAGYTDLVTGTPPAYAAKALWTTPPGLSSGLLSNGAWLAFQNATGAGVVKAVVGASNFATATTLTLTVPGRPTTPPPYLAFAPAPQGGERLYALYSGGIDAIRTTTAGQPVLADVLTFPLGFSGAKDMASGTTALSKKRVYVVNATTLIVYEPLLPSPYIGSVALAGGAVSVRLSSDGRFVLVARHPLGSGGGQTITSVTTIDADTLAVVRENATAVCPSGATCPAPAAWPMAVTVDGSHAFIADPVQSKLELMYLDPPDDALVPQFLTDAIAAVNTEAWLDVDDRDALLALAAAAAASIEAGQVEESPEEKTFLMTQAAEDIGAIDARVDGCFGGSTSDDVLSDCYEASGIHYVAKQLLESLAPYLVEPPEEQLRRTGSRPRGRP